MVAVGGKESGLAREFLERASNSAHGQPSLETAQYPCLLASSPAEKKTHIRTCTCTYNIIQSLYYEHPIEMLSYFSQQNAFQTLRF